MSARARAISACILSLVLGVLLGGRVFAGSPVTPHARPNLSEAQVALNGALQAFVAAKRAFEFDSTGWAAKAQSEAIAAQTELGQAIAASR